MRRCRSSNNLHRSICPILDQQTGYPAESLVVCHQYCAGAQCVRGNQQIKRRKYLALTLHIGPHSSVMLGNGIVPGQYIDAPQELAHGEVEPLGTWPLRQAKKKFTFGDGRDAKVCNWRGYHAPGDGWGTP